MPRPSLKDQRSAEILDAYLTCVAQFGLEGATQERIAAQAQVKRPLLRHYLGNRDQMVAALNDHVINTFNAKTRDLVQALDTVETPLALVDLLFVDTKEHDPRLLLAWQALTVTAPEHPDRGAALLDSLDQFLIALTDTLRRLAPEATPATLRAVAQGISSAFVTLDSLSPLAPPPNWRAELRQAALLLTRCLEDAA